MVPICTEIILKPVAKDKEPRIPWIPREGKHGKYENKARTHTTTSTTIKTTAMNDLIMHFHQQR